MASVLALLAFRTDRLVGHRLLDGPKLLLFDSYELCELCRGLRVLTFQPMSPA